MQAYIATVQIVVATESEEQACAIIQEALDGQRARRKIVEWGYSGDDEDGLPAPFETDGSA